MVAGASKILTVSYGTFSCTLEGFDDPFVMMRAIAEYFRELAAEDRYFGAEPPQPDAEALQRLASRETRTRVEARVGASGLMLRAAPAESATEEGDGAAARIDQDVAAKLDRIRRAVAEAQASAGDGTESPLADAEPAIPHSARAGEGAPPFRLESPLPGGVSASSDPAGEGIEALPRADTGPAFLPQADAGSDRTESRAMEGASPARKDVDAGDISATQATAVFGARDSAAAEEVPANADAAPLPAAFTDASGSPRQTDPDGHTPLDQGAQGDMADSPPVSSLADGESIEDRPDPDLPRVLPDTGEPPQGENFPQPDGPQSCAPHPAAEAPDFRSEAAGTDSAEADLRRLFDATGEQLPGGEGQRRPSAVAQLRAALAATIAEHLSLGRRKAPDPDPQPDPPASRPAPLVLVTAQRITDPETAPRAEAPEWPARSADGTVHPQPIRFSRMEAQLARSFDGSGSPCDPATAQSFARFARSHGSHGLDDLLEAAAAYTAQIEGHSHFSPPDIMHKLSAVADEGEFTPEERLRVFGRLLRQGKITKIKPGQYTIAEASRFYQKRA